MGYLSDILSGSGSRWGHNCSNTILCKRFFSSSEREREFSVKEGSSITVIFHALANSRKLDKVSSQVTLMARIFLVYVPRYR